MEAFKSARGFLHLDNSIAWERLFQGIKPLIKSGDIPDPIRAAIKSWLKASDPYVACMALTVLESLAFNGSTRIRQILAGPKWSERFAKQLAKPQSVQVQSALAQMLVDWAHLFSKEELGQMSASLLEPPQYRTVVYGMQPSLAAQDIQEDWHLGVPPVGPYKANDFSTALRFGGRGGEASTSHTDSAPHHTSAPGTLPGPAGLSSSALQRPTNTLHHSNSADARLVSAINLQFTGLGVNGLRQSQQCLGPEAVPSLISQMSAHSQDMRRASHAARTALSQLQASGQLSRHNANYQQQVSHNRPQLRLQSSGSVTPALHPALAPHIDAGYRASERCSAWRLRVAELSQTLSHHPSSVSQLLTALDSVNAALSDWQQFASGGELFKALSLPEDPARPWRGATPRGQQHRATGHTNNANNGPDLLLDLLDGDSGVGSGFAAVAQQQSTSSVIDSPQLPAGAAAAAAAAHLGTSLLIHDLTHGAITSTSSASSSAAAAAGAAYGNANPFASLNAAPATNGSHGWAFTQPTTTQPQSQQQAGTTSAAFTTNPLLLRSSQPAASSSAAAQAAASSAASLGQASSFASHGEWGASTGAGLGAGGVGGGGPSGTHVSVLSSQRYPSSVLSDSPYNGHHWASQPANTNPHGAAAAFGSSSMVKSSSGMLQQPYAGDTGASGGVGGGGGGVFSAPMAGGTGGGVVVGSGGGGGVGPDWQGLLGAILSRANAGGKAQVGLRVEGELRSLLQHMQQHYEETIAGTKERAVAVVKELRSQLDDTQATLQALQTQHTQLQAQIQQPQSQSQKGQAMGPQTGQARQATHVPQAQQHTQTRAQLQAQQYNQPVVHGGFAADYGGWAVVGGMGDGGYPGAWQSFGSPGGTHTQRATAAAASVDLI